MTSNLTKEHEGIAKIHFVCSKMDSIWRATNTADLGIDGQIEFLQENKIISTGYILAVQSKSGASYFVSQSESHIRFYAENKHIEYWKKLNLPIILVLHNPDTDVTIYARIKTQLYKGNPILISKEDIFSKSARENLLKIAKEDIVTIDPKIILDELKEIQYSDNGKSINGTDFLIASINLEEKYFELRMCRIDKLLNLAEIELDNKFFDFILRCVLKILHKKITVDFEEDFERIWFGESKVPDVKVPLMPFGIEVVSYLFTHIDNYFSKKYFNSLGKKNSSESARIIPILTDLESRKMDDHIHGTYTQEKGLEYFMIVHELLNK